MNRPRNPVLSCPSWWVIAAPTGYISWTHIHWHKRAAIDQFERLVGMSWDDLKAIGYQAVKIDVIPQARFGRRRCDG